MVGGVEEIGRAQVVVALLLLGVDAGGFYAYLDFGIGQVRFIDEEPAAPFLKMAPDLGNHQVPHGKPDIGMHGIEIPLLLRHIALSIGMVTIP